MLGLRGACGVVEESGRGGEKVYLAVRMGLLKSLRKEVKSLCGCLHSLTPATARERMMYSTRSHVRCRGKKRRGVKSGMVYVSASAWLVVGDGGKIRRVFREE